jgi:citrate lyase beta subunit
MGATPSLATARSLLFAPGDDADKLAKALGSGADGVIADLEDGVASSRRAAAREIVRESLGAADGPCLRAVRVNRSGSDELAEDLAAVAGLALDAIVVPKAEPGALAELGETGPPLIAIVETSAGLRSTYDLAMAPRVAALALGALDLGVELRLERRADGQELLLARSRLVADSAAAGVRPPFDTVFAALADLPGLEEECGLARSLGLRGKLCVHPRQVEVVNAAFSPTAAELEHARLVVDAYERAEADGRGAIQVEGMLVDRPVAELARRLLEDAGLSSPGGE